MELIRQFKYLIKPDFDQKQIIVETFGAVRLVHNHFIEDLNKGKYMGGKAVRILERYRGEFPFLNSIDGSALINAIFQAQDSYKSLNRFKSRKDSFASYTTSNLQKSQIRIIDQNHLLLPKLGQVEIVCHRSLPERSKIRKATLMRYPDGKYYISICVSWIVPDVSVVPDPEKVIGIDYSSAHLFVDNLGNMVNMPHFYADLQDRLTAERNKLQKMVFGSKNYYKQKMKLASLYHHIKNQRHDFLHKLTTSLADKYDAICMEDLDMKEISQSYDLGKRTYDNAYGIFQRMLVYKMKERGKKVLYVDRYYPSSKTCSVCGHINSDLKLSERKWECPRCHTILDRDVNAAINIRKECLKKLL